MTDTGGISCCFDRESASMEEDFQKNGLGEASRLILTESLSRLPKGSTSLELGCGVGGLTVSLVKAGITSAVGIDLSPKMVEAAKSLAVKSGVSDAASFSLGDGATLAQGPADLVVLDSVLCCYPDVVELVERSSSCARRLYAMSLPDSRRLITKLLRPFLSLQGLVNRRSGFRFYIPSLEDIISQLQDKGFTKVFDSQAGRVWSVLLFAAPVGAD